MKNLLLSRRLFILCFLAAGIGIFTFRKKFVER